MNEFEKAMNEVEKEMKEQEEIKEEARQWLAGRSHVSGEAKDFEEFTTACVEEAKKNLRKNGSWASIDFEAESVDVGSFPRAMVIAWCLNRDNSHSLDAFALTPDFYTMPIEKKLLSLENSIGARLAELNKIPFFVCTAFCARAALVDVNEIRHAQAVEVSLLDTDLNLSQVVSKEKIQPAYILSIRDSLKRYDSRVLRFVQPSFEVEEMDASKVLTYIPPFPKAVIVGAAEHHAIRMMGKGKQGFERR